MDNLPAPLQIKTAQATWRWCGLYLAVHFLLACAGHALSIPPLQAPWMWPAAGFLPSMLGFTPHRQWPLLIGAAAVAEMLALLVASNVTIDTGSLLVIGGNMLEALIAALVVTLLLPQPWYRRTSIEILAYVCVAAIVTPLVGATLTFGVTLLESESFALATNVFSAWWAADLLGIVLVNPLIGGAMLAFSIPSSTRPRHFVTAGVVLLVWLTVVVFLVGRTEGPPAFLGTLPTTALSFLVLGLSLTCALILALRVPPILTAAGSIIMAITLNLFASVLPTPFGHQLFSSASAPHAAHLILIASSVCSFLVALVRFENRHAKHLSILRRTPDRIMADIATRLGSCTADTAEECIRQCLETLGRVAGADRCVVIEFDRRGDTFSQTFRWHRPGVSDSRSTIQNKPLSAVAETLRSTTESGSLYLRLQDVPPDSAQYQFMRAVDAVAVAYAPLRRSDGIVGVVGLTWIASTRRWTRDTSVLLQSTAQVLGGTLMRVDAQRNDQSYRERLRELTGQMVSLDDEIRRETAADLHDGAAQSLAVARLRLAQIRSHKAPSPEALRSVEEMIVTALSEIRGVIRRMIPSELYELGLVHALRQFVTESRQQLDFDLSMTVDGDIDRLSEHIAGLVYRAARELITNAIKHASAQSAKIHVHQTSSMLHLRVSDDGRGFQARRSGQRAADGTGLGLFSLRERLRAVGGDISISSDRDGTQVEIVVPRHKTLTAAEHPKAV
ncbi:MAG: ATP-binding protein [Gammaproteobacteria bacterium]